MYNPELFQGSLKKKNYFEGWYFKHVSSDLSQVWSFIPGISLAGTQKHAFIQVINGITGKTDYVTYPVDAFTWDRKKFEVGVGRSRFTQNYMVLDMETENGKISGRIEYSNLVRYPKKILSPGIMGWYSFIPFMECKHGIVSVNHRLAGALSIHEEIVDFSGGKGYIEKDWGTSFPEAWIWIQANTFLDSDTSFNFSVAKIPWLGNFFIGFIGFIYFRNTFYLYSTYNRSVLTKLHHEGESLEIELKNHNSVLKVRALKKTFGELAAPVSGDMTRRIKESVDSEVFVELYNKNGQLLYKDSSQRAGLEIIEKIFDMI